jgi:acetylornithine deacetylase/succinyl-diaminopimelate desuccinylase-like protein
MKFMVLLSALTLAAVHPSVHAANRAVPPEMQKLVGEPNTQSILAQIDRSEEESQKSLMALGAIISPSGQEQHRAEEVARQMRAIGLTDVRITDAPNVIGKISGRSGRALVFVSTLDDLATVAEHQRESGKPPNLSGRRIVGPGTNTSLTTSAMLAAAAALQNANIQPEHDLIFAAVAEEETGLGGMRALYSAYQDKAIGFVDILGDGVDLAYGALGIHWWKVIASGPAGHTLHGGLPNVNQAIGRSVDQILSLPHPQKFDDHHTRINVSILQSGAVFNHKPSSGWFSLDIRSLDGGIIANIETDVRNILQKVSQETGIRLEMKPENMTPGGQIPGALNTPLVRWSHAAARFLGKEGALHNKGSANLNIAIAGGTSAIGLGGERGGARGQAEEWADVDVLNRTAKLIALLALSVGEDRDPPSIVEPQA